MKTIIKNAWHPLPLLNIASPVFALAVGPNGIWASGTGGIAWHTATDGWEARIATLPLSSVTTLLYNDGLLLAGGFEGIAISKNGGLHWERATLEENVASITALAASPRFGQDGTVVAGTLAHGILRTEDHGRTWVSASFGLESFEVTALAWLSGSVLLAATSDGIYRSADAGRAWHRVYEDEVIIDTLASLSQKEVLATLEDGGLLRSNDGGRHWSPDDSTLQDAHILSLYVKDVEDVNESKQEELDPKTIFAGTLEQGLLRSTDEGATWEKVYHASVISLAVGNNCLYAGTDHGVSKSDDGGRTWYELACPPVHDLARLLIYEKQPLLMGAYAGLVCYTDAGWKVIADLPQALTSTVIAPDGSLFVSSPDGLIRLPREGGSQELVEGQDGQVRFMTFRRNGSAWQAWAASGDGTRLVQSNDEGRSWQTVHTPFGVLPIVALQVLPDRIVAATYDARQHRLCIWFTTNDGESWERGVEAETPWSVVATNDDPPLVTMSHLMLIQNNAGEWRQVQVGVDGGMVRRVVSARPGRSDDHMQEDELAQSTTTLLFALTTTGIQRSDDWGASWQQDNEGLPVEQIMDIAARDTDLYVLLAGGQVWKCAV